MSATVNTALRRGTRLFILCASLCAVAAYAQQSGQPVWLLTIDGTPHATPDPQSAWHGRLMVIAWSVFAPVGVLIARFYKVTPKQKYPQRLDNQFWWITHQLLQYSCLLLTFAAMVVVMNRAHTVTDTVVTTSTVFGLSAKEPHSLAGWTLLVLCALQVCGAWLRGSKGGPVDPNEWPDCPVTPGDHYNRTQRRVVFEILHVYVGYFCLGLALITTVLGLLVSGAPRWMWLILFLWWTIYMSRYIQLHRRGAHIRTYQAIWGPSPNHPGNQVGADNVML